MRPPKLAAPFQFPVFLVAGWIHRRQQLAIAYLQAENRVLRERLGKGRLLFTDAERKLLAEKGEGLGRPCWPNWRRSQGPRRFCVGTVG